MNTLDRIKHIVSWIKNLFDGIPEDIKHYAAIALQVTGKIKQVIDNPVVVSIVELTPTNIDDEVRAKLSLCLSILQNWLHAETIDKAIDTLREMPKKVQNAMLIKLASEITACLDNGQDKESNYDLAVQAAYSNGKLS